MLTQRLSYLRGAALPAAGLASWLATLLIFSSTVTPFQRFGLSFAMNAYVLASLIAAAVFSVVVIVAQVFGRRLSPRALVPGGACLYVLGCALFAALVFIGHVPSAVAVAVGICVGLGSAATGVAWGRVFRVLEVRASLASVAVAGMLLAGFSLLLGLLPAQACVAVFIGLSAFGAFAPMLSSLRAGLSITSEDEVERSPLKTRLFSFASVAAMPLAGLVSFAFVMGTMRALIVDAHPLYLASLVIDSAVLMVLALIWAKHPVMNFVYRGLLPVLAVVVLAVTAISGVMGMGYGLDYEPVFLLYTLAGLLTLATVAFIAHAGEFPSDTVVAAAVTLFSAASVAGLLTAQVMTAETVRVSTTVITTVYACVLLIVSTIRSSRADASLALFAAGATNGVPEQGEDASAKVKEAAASSASYTLADYQERLEARCAEVASTGGLTAREAEVLVFLAEGHTSGFISQELCVSSATVRTHVHNIYRKLNVLSREQLIELVRRGD